MIETKPHAVPTHMVSRGRGAVAVAFVATAVWFIGVTAAAIEMAGDDATQEEIARATQEMMASGKAPTSPVATGTAIAGALCGLGGLTMAVMSLVRQEPRRVMAIIACIISVCFSCCQGLVLLAQLGSRMHPA